MPNDVPNFDDWVKARTPRERVFGVARSEGIPDDIAEDYLKLTRIESGHNVNVRNSPKGARGFGQVMPDVKGGTTRTVGGRQYDLRDPDQNITAGLRYFAEGGQDPVARRLHYFGGPRARQNYERTGKIPNISDGNLTAMQYVQATGGQSRKEIPAFDQWSATNEKEAAFRRWYEQHAKRQKLNPDPDDPGHHYDYRAAYQAGASPDASGHWPSKFKRPDHPNRYVDGEDTITGQRIPNFDDWSKDSGQNLPPSSELKTAAKPAKSPVNPAKAKSVPKPTYSFAGRAFGEPVSEQQRDALRRAIEGYESPQATSGGVGELRRIENQERQRTKQMREEARREIRARRGAYGQPTPSGMLHLFANPIGSFTDLRKSEDEQVEDLVRERQRAESVASQPEVTEIRREYGQMSAPMRSAVGPLARGGAGMLKLVGGLSSLGGYLPKGYIPPADKLTEYVNRRAEIIESGAAQSPLTEADKEVERGIPEKIATGLADLGVGLGQIILLKKASKLSFPQLLALEGALKASDKPASEQVARAAEGYALGVGLERFTSRAANAAISGLPTAAQTGYEVSQGRMSPVDAAIQTGIQTGAGALLTNPRAGERRGATGVPTAEPTKVARSAESIIQEVFPEGKVVKAKIRFHPEEKQDLKIAETAPALRRLERMRASRAAREAGETSQRFYHKDWGEVEVLEDQSGARPGRVKVAEVADPTKQHFPRRSDLSGRGNQRMVPVKQEQAAPNLEAGIVEPPESETFLRDKSGQPLTVYHQTTKEAEQAIRASGFDLSKARARRSDEGVPDGVFFKPNKGSIFTDLSDADSAELAANLRIKSPLEVETREELVEWARRNDPDYAKLADKVEGYDRRRAYENREKTEEYNNLIKDATAARARLTQALRREGYDGVIIERDVGGPQVTKTYIALDPGQVKLLEPETTGAASSEPTAKQSEPAPPVPKGFTRYYRADRPGAEGPEGGGWSNNLDYVSQKYGAGASGSGESVWYVDVPNKTLEAEYGDVQSASILRGNPKELGATEPRLYRRVSAPKPSQPASEPANKISAETTTPGLEATRLPKPVKRQGETQAEFNRRKILAEAEAGEGKTVRPAPTHAVGRPKADATRNSVSSQARALGGIKPTENFRGEVDRLKLIEGHRGLVNETSGLDPEQMITALAQDGYRLPGVEFNTGGRAGFTIVDINAALEAIEMDARGITPLHSTAKEFDFSAAEAEYYAEQEARIRAEEVRDNFLESGRGAELFDKVRDGKANDAERAELTKLASEIGITKSELEDTLAGARAEIEGLEEVRSERPRTPTRPAEQLGFVQEGLTQQTAPPSKSTSSEISERLLATPMYRGTTEGAAEGTGLSWTADRELAIQRALAESKRTGRAPVLLEGHVTAKRPYVSEEFGLYDKVDQLPVGYDAALNPSLREVYIYDPKQISGLKRTQLNPERTAALAKLEEIKRRGMTVDDYARQPDLTGKVPGEAEIKALKDLESAERESAPDQSDKLGFDEQIEERHGGFPIGRALFGERPRVDTLGPKSVNPEAEARMKAAEGVQPPSVIRRAKEGMASVYHSFKRTFPEINPNKDDVSAVVNDHLRQLLAAPNYAKALAFDKIAEITQNLGKERLRVFSRNLILPDILKDIDAGLYNEKPLPFGYKDRSQIETDLAKFREAADSTPAIKDALERRQAFTKALTEKLVSLELLPKEVLDDPRYYHRQVMEYVDNPAWVGTGSGDARLHRKGFQKGRVGGGDFNTRYQEAEFEWTAQALALIARKETLARIQQIADIRPALELEAKLWNDAHPTDQKTWQQFVPDTHSVWQPVKGSHFYPTMSITERTMDKILSGEKAFEESDVREILALGGKRQQWAIPEEIAKTLDGFRPDRDEGPIANLWTQAQSSWKQWVLLNPIRVLKYNLNNISGDLDITLAYNPKILKQAPRAARELWNYQVKGQGSAKTKAEIQDAIKRGVVDSGLTIVEIPDINKTGAFRGLTSPDPNVIQRTVQSYWGGVKTFTSWRENILRYSAYKHFQERIAKGEQVYGASTKSQIDAIKNPNDKAAKLARELVGDYGAVSHAGQWIRRHLIPFYSWIEVNAPRYARLMRNLPHEGKSPARATATRVLTGAPKLLAKASVLYVAAQLWNHAMFPDEEKELRATGRTPHLIMGRNEDGSIRVLRVEGALADALEWFGAEDLPYDVADIAKGKKGAGPKAKLAEAVKAPAERLVQSFEPFAKTIFETASGRTAYPSLFEKGESFKIRPRVIRDRAENVARVVSLDSLYRRVTGRPSPPSNGPLNYIVNNVLAYRVDPGEAAYWDFRGKAFDWTKEKGKESGAADPTARSNALYYYKQALKWHDEKAAKKWLAEYYRLGGSDKGMAQSLRMGHPLGSIKKDDQAEFLNSLTDEERATLELAEKWYTKTYGEIKTSGRPPRPPAPPKPEAPARP